MIRCVAHSLKARKRMSEAVVAIRGTNTEHFWAKVAVGAHDECWPWLGPVWNGGYGGWRVGSRTDGTRRSVQAHRQAYELTHGPVAPDVQVDHQCHNLDGACPGGPCAHRLCCNPAHLEAVTRLVNMRRGRNANQRKTSCKHGHPLEGANLYVEPNGKRRCRECLRRRNREHYQRLVGV